VATTRRGPGVAPRSLLKGIIAPRVEETLELLRDRLKSSGAPIEPGAGLVLTGGASQLAGVREVAVGCSTARCAWAVRAACRTWPTPRPALPSPPPPASCIAPPSAPRSCLRQGAGVSETAP
jgi:hypothetical protein